MLWQGGCKVPGSATASPSLLKLPRGCQAAAQGEEGQVLDWQKGQASAQPGLGCQSAGGAAVCSTAKGREDSVHQRGKETQALERGVSLYFGLLSPSMCNLLGGECNEQNESDSPLA